jgi:hypothetical protein
MVSHLFLECLVSHLIYIEISIWVGLPRLLPQSLPADPLLPTRFSDISVSSSARTKGAQSLDILVCWSLWWEHNERIFEYTEKPPHHLVAKIKDEAKLWILAGAKLP